MVKKSSKMVWDIKIAHFDPGSDGICPVVCLSDFSKMVIYIFLGVPGHFFTLNAFMERDPRGI